MNNGVFLGTRSARAARGAMLRGIAAASVCFGAGCQPTSEPPDIKDEDISFQVGIDNATTKSRWSFARLKVRNHGADFNGILEVEGVGTSSGEDSLDPVLYRLKLEIPGKSSTFREFSFPVFPEGWETAHAVLRQPGYSREVEALSVARGKAPFDSGEQESSRQLLVIGEQVPEFNALRETLVEVWQLSDSGSVHVTKVPPRDLPQPTTAYDSFALVIAYGASLNETPAGAMEGLIRWVERGGTLIAFPGPSWSSGLSDASRRLFGVQCGPGRALPPELAARLGKTTPEGYFADLTAVGPTVREADGLVFASPLGTGQVFTMAFTPTGEKFPPRPAAAGLYEAFKAVSSRAIGEPIVANTSAFEGAAESCLRKLASFQTPPRSSVVWGLLIYLGVGFFLPWTLFRALKRPEWTYAAVIAASAGFTFGIYRYGLLSALQMPELEELTILRLHADGSAAEAASFVGVMAPSAARVSLFQAEGADAVQHPLASALPRPYLATRRRSASWTAGLLEDRHVIEVDRAGRLRLEPVALHPNELRAVRYDYRLNAGDVPVASSRLSLAGAAIHEASGIVDLLRHATDVKQMAGRAPDVTACRASVFPGAPEITRRNAITIILQDGPGDDGK